MGNLEIIDKTSKMGFTLPHKIYINGKAICILKAPSMRIESMPQAYYRLHVESMIPFISAEALVKVEEGSNKVCFRDKEKLWDSLFLIDIVMLIAKCFVTFPDTIELTYKIFTNGYGLLWLIREWIIRKKYFKIEQIK